MMCQHFKVSFIHCSTNLFVAVQCELPLDPTHMFFQSLLPRVPQLVTLYVLGSTVDFYAHNRASRHNKHALHISGSEAVLFLYIPVDLCMYLMIGEGQIAQKNHIGAKIDLGADLSI